MCALLSLADAVFDLGGYHVTASGLLEPRAGP